jgi:hypothetical protein
LQYKNPATKNGGGEMPGVEILLCLVGAFYAFAGFAATRAGLTSHFVDRAIAAIAAKKPSRAETMQTYWLLAAAAVIGAGGLALMFLIDVAVWLFLASATGQAIYLLYLAPRFFDAAEAPDAAGRRQTINAFVIYLASTAFVVWGYLNGKLLTVSQSSWPALALPAALVVAHIVYVLRTLSGAPTKSPLSGFSSADDGDDTGPNRDPSVCSRIKVMADYECHPLWALDEDLYGDFPPEALELSPELTRDLNAWAEAFTASFDRDDPIISKWSDEEAAAHAAMARPLAIRLARERPDRTIFVLEGDIGVVEVRADEELPAPRGGAGVG